MLNFTYTKYQNRELSIVVEAAKNEDIEAKNELLLRSPFNGKKDILKMDAILLCSEILRRYPNHLLANCCWAISALQNKDAGLAEQYLLLALQDITFSRVEINLLLNELDENVMLFLYESCLANKIKSQQLTQILITQYIIQISRIKCQNDRNFKLFVVYCLSNNIVKAEKYLHNIPLEYLAKNSAQLTIGSNRIMEEQNKDKLNHMLFKRFTEDENHAKTADFFLENISNNFKIEIPVLDKHFGNLMNLDPINSNLAVFKLKKNALTKLNKQPDQSLSGYPVAVPLLSDKISCAIRNGIALLKNYWNGRNKRIDSSLITLFRFFPGEVLGNGDRRLKYINEAIAIGEKLDVNGQNADFICEELNTHIQKGKRLFPKGMFSGEMAKTFAAIENMLNEVLKPVNNNTAQLVI